MFRCVHPLGTVDSVLAQQRFPDAFQEALQGVSNSDFLGIIATFKSILDHILITLLASINVPRARRFNRATYSPHYSEEGSRVVANMTA